MNLADVMDELGTALGTVVGLRVFPYSASRITPPAAVVGWPETLDYDATMGRGSDRATLPVTVLTGMVDARSARDDLAQYCDGSGSKSIKTVLEAGNYTACDSVTVRSVRFEAVTVASIEYLSATFDVDIFGEGA